MNTLTSKKIGISARMNRQDLKTLSGEASIETVSRFIESTSVGKRVEAYDAQPLDEYDIELFDRKVDEELRKMIGGVRKTRTG